MISLPDYRLASISRNNFVQHTLYEVIRVYCTNNYLKSSLGNIQRFVGRAVKERLAELGKKSQFMGFRDKKHRITSYNVCYTKLLRCITPSSHKPPRKTTPTTITVPLVWGRNFPSSIPRIRISGFITRKILWAVVNALTYIKYRVSNLKPLCN